MGEELSNGSLMKTFCKESSWAGVQHIHIHRHGDCAFTEGQCFDMIATRMKLIANNDYKDCRFGGQSYGDSGNIDGAHGK